jgi:heme iron utilization protein
VASRGIHALRERQFLRITPSGGDTCYPSRVSSDLKQSTPHNPSDPTEQASEGPARAPSHAERCRTLVAAARTGSLSTLALDPAGYPYGSLVNFAADAEGRPLLLLSDLAEHTHNLAVHAEASVLVTEAAGRAEGESAGAHEPLAEGRATLLGLCRRVPEDEREAVRAAFVKVHPGSDKMAHFAGFKDFAFYRLEPVAIRYIGGFGRMSWVDIESYRLAEPDPIVSVAAGIISHMNKDHADALLGYAKVLCQINGATSAVMTSVDRYGFEIQVATAGHDGQEGHRSARLAFESPASGTNEIRKAMIHLLQKVRASEARLVSERPQGSSHDIDQ